MIRVLAGGRPVKAGVHLPKHHPFAPLPPQSANDGADCGKIIT